MASIKKVRRKPSHYQKLSSHKILYHFTSFDKYYTVGCIIKYKVKNNMMVRTIILFFMRYSETDKRSLRIM